MDGVAWPGFEPFLLRQRRRGSLLPAAAYHAPKVPSQLKDGIRVLTPTTRPRALLFLDQDATTKSTVAWRWPMLQQRGARARRRMASSVPRPSSVVWKPHSGAGALARRRPKMLTMAVFLLRQGWRRCQNTDTDEPCRDGAQRLRFMPWPPSPAMSPGHLECFRQPGLPFLPCAPTSSISPEDAQHGRQKQLLGDKLCLPGQVRGRQSTRSG